MNYLESQGVATSYRRSGVIRINNPLPGTGTPVIVFEEQDVVELAGGGYSVTPASSGPSGVQIAFDPTAEVDMLNPMDGTKIGTFTHTQFQVMLYSLYMAAAANRDAILAAQAAQAAADQAAREFAAANPTPSLSFTIPYAYNLTVGAQGQNVALSTLAGGQYGAVTYTSSDETVATVDALGNVTPVAPGLTTITAIQAAVLNANSEAQATYTLHVQPLPIPALTVAYSTVGPITVGSSTVNLVTTTLQGAPFGNLSYVSSDTDVATVDGQGNITAVAAGTSIITVTQNPVAGVNAQAQLEFTVKVAAAAQ